MVNEDQIVANKSDWCVKEFAAVEFGDARLKERFLTTARHLSDFPQAPINQACEDWADAKGAYRLFDNEKVKASEILGAHQNRTIERIRGAATVLAIQDTCYLMYGHHPSTKGLGKVTSSGGRGKGPRKNSTANWGLIMHTAFAVSTEGIPLGVVDQEIWARPPGVQRTKKERFCLGIEQKESFKWIRMLRKTVEKIPSDIHAVTVCDREADIFEFMLEAEQLRTSFLLRACFDRSINKAKKRSMPEEKLWAYLESCPSGGHVKVEVPHKGEAAAREAIVSVKAGSFRLQPPPNKTKNKDGNLGSLVIYAIHVKEVDAPDGEDPLEWMLLTNIPTQSFDEAVEKVNWYKLRWRIESFHKVLKSGCGIEDCRLQTADRLIRYVTLMCVIAWRLYWLTLANREMPDAPCTAVLSESEWKALYCKIKKTRILPAKTPTVREAIRWIARLGGFLARKCDGEPGMTTLWRGWKRLTDIAEDWALFHGG